MAPTRGTSETRQRVKRRSLWARIIDAERSECEALLRGLVILQVKAFPIALLHSTRGRQTTVTISGRVCMRVLAVVCFLWIWQSRPEVFAVMHSANFRSSEVRWASPAARQLASPVA